jgi:hypothetical protein
MARALEESLRKVIKMKYVSHFLLNIFCAIQAKVVLPKLSLSNPILLNGGVF